MNALINYFAKIPRKLRRHRMYKAVCKNILTQDVAREKYWGRNA